jgi:hypothetical protein
MARPTKTPARTPFIIRSLVVTPDMQHLLQALGREASDALGWTVSMSAITRALLRYVERQPTSWARKQLFPLIKQEIAEGRVWGKTK